MEKVDFDKHAENYEDVLTEDLEIFGEESGYFADYKIKLVKDNLTGKPCSILDFGCGIGRNIKYFQKYFPDSEITGCDISAKSIEIAQKNNPDVKFFLLNDENIRMKYGEFDLIFTSCVFHHIEPKLRRDSMEKIKQMMKSNGLFIIFEHNPYNPVTRKIVKDCIWDADAILLTKKETGAMILQSGLKIKKKKYTLFFPAFLKIFRVLEKFMGLIPAGGQYFFIAEKNT